jgi:hypothetical protein
MAVWYWAILTLAVAALVGLLVSLADVRFSAWSTITIPAAKYWMLVVGILLTAGYLRAFVAHGITRRHFIAGAALFGGGVTVAFAVITLLGLGVERTVFDAAGWLPRLNQPYPVSSIGDAAAHLGRTIPIYLGHLVAGWLISSNFYRYMAALRLVLGGVPIRRPTG